MTYDILRQASAVLGVLVSAGLAWRLVGDWFVITPLARALTITLGAAIFVSAYATTRALQEGLGSAHDVTVLTFVIRLAALVLVIGWPSLRKHRYPQDRP